MSERLSEKDVAEIRRHVEACRAYVLKGSENAFPDGPEDTLAILADAEKLLADRDAHLADLKDNTSLLMATRSIAVHMRDSQQGEPSGLNIIIRNIDALLERTK